MKAYLSGQAGVALLNEGEKWFVLKSSASGLSKTRVSSAIRFLDGSTDVEELVGVLPDSIAPRLKVAQSKDVALQYVLTLLEANELGSLEQQMLRRLNELLQIPEVFTYALNRLYAAPQPSRNIHMINILLAREPRHPLADLLKTVLSDQLPIARAHLAWELVSTGRFPEVHDRDVFFLSAVDEGFVRALVTDATAPVERNLIINARREIWNEWGDAFKGASARTYPSEHPASPLMRDPGQRQGEPQGSVASAEDLPTGSTIVLPQAELFDRAHQFNPRFTFESFVVGSGNQIAQTAARSVATNPAGRYNPLLIYGGLGMGKTHLMHAIGRELAEKFGSRVIYTSADQFVDEMMSCFRTQRMNQFRQHFGGAEVLLVDDVHRLAYKEYAQEELLNTVETLKHQGKQIVMSSELPPDAIPGLESRLRSRFDWGVMADIQPPDLKTKIAILKKKAQVEGVKLTEDVLGFVASKAKSNLRELEGYLTRLIAYASVTGARIDLTMARQTLRSIEASQKRRVTLDSIQKAVAAKFELTESELKSRTNTKKVVFARQVAMYLMKEVTRASLPEIGHAFGMHHTTVIHAIEKIGRARSIDPELNKLLRDLIGPLQ
jgi:chromosomal replication initiator protein